MAEPEKLYEAFGELLYALAKADGNVQNEERTILKNILKDYPFESDILWSFNYEEKKQHSVKDAYKKAMDIFLSHGPFSEYGKFAEILEKLASASEGISKEEKAIILGFQGDLMKAFKDNPNIQ
jgi:uncharacterized tellurite resistance protein B-like protein